MTRTALAPSNGDRADVCVRPSSAWLVIAGVALVTAVACGSSGDNSGAGGNGGSGGRGGSGGSAGGKGGSGGSTGGSHASGGSGGSDGATGGSGGASGNGGSSASGGSGSGGSGSGDDGGSGSGGSGSGDDGGTGTGGTGGSSDTGGTSGAADGGGTGGAGGTTAMSGPGCPGGTCQNPNCMPNGTAAPVDMYPEIGYEPMPSYIPNNMIIPTFDDAPDGVDSPPDVADGAGEWTKQDIAFFDKNNQHMDFFINTDNYCGPILDNPGCKATLMSILKNHSPANHTVHHIHMGGNTPPNNGIPDSCGGAKSGVTCEDELAGVETVINTISNGAIPHLTRFRPPYGEPYQERAAGLAAVQKAVSKYAVAVGWNFDSGDSADCPTPTCFTGDQIAQNVETAIGDGPGKGTAWGVILMHGTHRWTHDAVLKLFDPKTGYIAAHNFKLATVEDAICWKYGMHSWQIMSKLTGKTIGPN